MFIGQACYWFFLYAIQKEILKTWHQNSIIKKEMDMILSKLEEAIITKDKDNKISITNQRGDKIIRMIYASQLKKVLDDRNDAKSAFSNDISYNDSMID